jgi:D-3-phosphoglycerate dehydrogenase
MAGYRVYVAETSYSDYSREQAVVNEAGGELRFAHCRSEADIISQCADATAILLRQTPMGPEAFSRLKQLRVVARYGTGYDNVNIEAATSAGVVVTIVPDYCVGEVADHAAALLFAAVRGISIRDRAVRSGEWDLGPRVQVCRTGGKTLGLIGYGKTARELRKRLSGFPFRFAACSPTTDPDLFKQDNTLRLDLDTLLMVSDYVSLHVPLNDQTRHLLDLNAFRKMRPNAVLINTSRGGVVNQRDLCTALQNGYIAGAALDVYEDEPLAPDDPLCTLDSVILSDHAAWYSEESLEELQLRTVQEAVRVVQGLVPENPVNPEVLPRTNTPVTDPDALPCPDRPSDSHRCPTPRPRNVAERTGCPAPLRR